MGVCFGAERWLKSQQYFTIILFTKLQNEPRRGKTVYKPVMGKRLELRCENEPETFKAEACD